MTPSGIEAVTFQFAAKHLNHCATAGLQQYNYFQPYLSYRLVLAMALRESRGIAILYF